MIRVRELPCCSTNSGHDPDSVYCAIEDLDVAIARLKIHIGATDIAGYSAVEGSNCTALSGKGSSDSKSWVGEIKVR